MISAEAATENPLQESLREHAYTGTGEYSHGELRDPGRYKPTLYKVRIYSTTPGYSRLWTGHGCRNFLVSLFSVL